MTFSPEWIFGTILAIMLAVIGFQFKQIGDLRADLNDVKEKYLRRDDGNGKIDHIEKSIDAVRLDIKEITATLLKVLLALGKAGAE